MTSSNSDQIERQCHFCGQSIPDGQKAVEATTKNAWAHFECWYDGGPVPAIDDRKSIPPVVPDTLPDVMPDHERFARASSGNAARIAALAVVGGSEDEVPFTQERFA